MNKLRIQWLGLRDQTQLKRFNKLQNRIEDLPKCSMGREKKKVIYTEDSMRRHNMSLIEVSKGEEGDQVQRQEFSINDERQCSYTGLENPSKVKKKKNLKRNPKEKKTNYLQRNNRLTAGLSAAMEAKRQQNSKILNP